MNIKPKLQLNKHPEMAADMSLVTAKNVRLSNDGGCIMNEESIVENTMIREFLANHYKGEDNFRIVGIIPCNVELVIIAINPDILTKPASIASIFRYREARLNNKEEIKLAYDKLKYYGGKIKGTFTYNVEGSLILAIAEYDAEENYIPLRTINLGNFDDDLIANDRELDDSMLATAPEVRIPSTGEVNYIPGNSYKGWYYLFIRFKINTVDYTQWYNFGTPIYVDSLNKQKIIRYCYYQRIDEANVKWIKNRSGIDNDVANLMYPHDAKDGHCAGATDWFSDDKDIANVTFSVPLKFHIANMEFEKYQIGIICASKTYTKAFRSEDLNLTSTDDTFIFNANNLIESSSAEFISEHYNYYDVGNVINYKNRLYISNYKETLANSKKLFDADITKNIKVNLSYKKVIDNEYSYDGTVSNFNSFVVYTSPYPTWTGLNVIKTYHIRDVNEYPYKESTQYEILAKSLDENEPFYINGADYFGTKNGFEEVTIFGEATCITITGGTNYLPACKLTFTAQQLRIVPATGSYKLDPDTGFIKHVDTVYPCNISFLVEQVSNKYWFKDVVEVLIPSLNIKTRIDCRYAFFNYGVNYINPKNTFEHRIKNRIFLPGEVYSFYIHFVNKYGHCTNGYRINNNTVWTADGISGEVVPIPFRSVNNEEAAYSLFIAAAPVNQDILSGNGEDINLANIEFYSGFAWHGSHNMTGRITDEDSIRNLRTAFHNAFSSFIDKKYIGVKWYQITSGFGCTDPLPYYNNKGEKLFKMPSHMALNTEYGGYVIDVSGVTIPPEYEGWFLSYEKFEPISRVTGMLTRSDFKSQATIFDNVQIWDEGFDLDNDQDGDKPPLTDGKNNYPSSVAYFYTGQYDIADSIKLDYNVMRIEGLNVWDKFDINPNSFSQRGSCYDYCFDMNKPQITSNDLIPPLLFAPTEYKLTVGDSAKDNRQGKGTALEMKAPYGLFETYTPNITDWDKEKNIAPNYVNLYKATFLNATRDIYMNDVKALIRCSNIVYGESSINNENIFPNGFVTIDGCLVYDDNGLTFNTADNIAYKTTSNKMFYNSKRGDHNTYVIYDQKPFLAYVQTPCYSDLMFESKCFKNDPQGVVFYVSQNEDKDKLDRGSENNTFAVGCMVEPKNSIDLFQNKQGSVDEFNPKTYVSYREDLVNQDEFNKTVRRSNVIQDESRVNGWRSFPVEGYKNIAENKGDITNLVGLGSMFLVHTQHSLFAIDTNNLLQANNMDIQLTQPDAFDVNYKEVLTSSLGFGGLQDDKAFVTGQFGYIYYNNDFHRFYNFDNGGFKPIDDGIIQWLDVYKPYNVRFADDVLNNRILIKIDYKYKDVEQSGVLSYNYMAKEFISTHDYYFYDAYNTKSKLYMRCNPELSNGCSLHGFVTDQSSYGKFDNLKEHNKVPTIKSSSIGVIINNSYEFVKFLDFIVYKLNKCKNPADVSTDYLYSPVEEMITPYSGDFLRIYNNVCDTGKLNILIDTEDAKNIFVNYKKPYWELGNWNFNYLRNKISEYAEYGNAFDMSRMYGNYFVIEFTFSNEDEKKVEFESLGCKFSSNYGK